MSEQKEIPKRNFCSEYKVLNGSTEIPPMFTAWCSLSAISAVLGRSLWIDMGPFKIYPNMYVILIAGSGRMRKSTAIGVTRKMLENLEPEINLISQKITPEALLDAMVVKETNVKQIEIGKGIPVGQGLVITDELTNFLNRGTIEAGIGPLLTDLYDCRDVFSYQTKARGKETIRETQLGILAATTPEELRKAVPEESIGSGLASRIMFVYENTPGNPIAFPTYTKLQLDAQDYCISSLQRISMLNHGAVKLDDDCIQWCTIWYNTKCYASSMMDDPHLRGYASRRFVHLLKIATNLSVGLKESPDICVDILERAEALLVANERYLPKVVQLVTMSEKGGTINYVLSIIARERRIARDALLRIISHRVDNRELLDIMETLKNSRQVHIEVNGASIYYTYKE